MPSSVETMFSLSEAEYLEAQKLYMRVKHKRAKAIRWITIGVMIVSFISVSITAPSGSLSTRPAILSIPIAIIIFLACTPWFQKLSLKKRFKVEGPMLKNVSVRVDEHGYHGFSSSGEGRLAWAAFDGFVVGPTVFVLLRGFTFNPLPKRTLSPTEQEAVEALLAAHLKRVGKAGENA